MSFDIFTELKSVLNDFFFLLFSSGFNLPPKKPDEKMEVFLPNKETTINITIV